MWLGRQFINVVGDIFVMGRIINPPFGDFSPMTILWGDFSGTNVPRGGILPVNYSLRRRLREEVASILEQEPTKANAL